MAVRNKRLSDEEFFRMREEVLAMWPTGREVDLAEAIEYHQSLPPSKNYALKLAEAERNGLILTSNAMGADTLERNIELLRYLQDKGEADFLSSWVDSMTRTGRFDVAENKLKEAERTGKVLLNGFPIVAYGVSGSRKLIESVDRPVQVSGPSLDERLVAEIATAGGYTFNHLGGPLVAFWNYTRDVLPEITIRNYQYIYRLGGYYEERGVPIANCVYGAMPCLTPPCLIDAPEIIEALIAAEQGAKNIQLYSTVQGNLFQDATGIMVIHKLADEYLHKFGYNDVITTVFAAYGGLRYPLDDAQAFALVSHYATVAVLGGAQSNSAQTIDEAKTVPTKEGNAATLRCMKMKINLLKDQKIDILENKAAQVEADMLEREIRAIADKVIDMGDGDVVIGVTRAVEAGVLDQPFSTNQHVLGKVAGVRDAEGAVRFLNHGNLPFANDIVEFHRQKIAEREKILGKKVDYDILVNDITALSKGRLLGGVTP
jgi:methylaspartate mutase epsilon subunit